MIAVKATCDVSLHMVARYLKNTDQLQTTRIRKVKNKLRSGVKDLLSFRDHDGSFRKTGGGQSSVW